MKFFFDFDDFFLDTEHGLVPETFQQYALLTGASLEDIYETYERFSKAKAETGKCYSIEEHLRFLQEYADFDLEKVSSQMRVFLADTSRYVYPGTEAFLSALQKEDSFLLTYGDEGFQTMKMKGSGIENFFSGSFITQGDKIQEIKKLCLELNIPADEKVVFGDNRCEYFTGAKEAGLITIHLKRPEDRASKRPCGECQYTVTSFDELLECIKNLE